MVDRTRAPITSSQLSADLSALGLRPGNAVMLHASVRAVGKVMGGPNVILQALHDGLGAEGTLMMYAGWEDIPDFVLDLPAELRQVYYDEHPPFDPAVSRAVRENSVLAEFLRTWPGTMRSQNPEASIIALGKEASWIVEDHSLHYGYAAQSPFARLIQLRGQVLLLGAPLFTVTLLHHAEALAKMRHKRVIHYQCPILRDGKKVWVDLEDYDTGETHDEYRFEEIMQDYFSSQDIRPGKVGEAESFLLDAAELTAFAVRWLEARFGPDS